MSARWGDEPRRIYFAPSVPEHTGPTAAELHAGTDLTGLLHEPTLRERIARSWTRYRTRVRGAWSVLRGQATACTPDDLTLERERAVDEYVDALRNPWET